VRVLSASGGMSSINTGVTASFDYFGSAVAANADWLLVGAPNEHRQSARTGAVYAYDLAALGPTPPSVLIAPDRAWRDDFGAALAVSGDTFLVGAPLAAGGRGSVSLYERSGGQWASVGKLTNPGTGSDFGFVMAADATAAVVGAYEGTWSAYWYERT